MMPPRLSQPIVLAAETAWSRAATVLRAIRSSRKRISSLILVVIFSLISFFS